MLAPHQHRWLSAKTVSLQFSSSGVQATRDEEDLADFIKQTVSALPEIDRVVILSDQLNTYVSEPLVRWVAESGGYGKEDLGGKGRKGHMKGHGHP